MLHRARGESRSRGLDKELSESTEEVCILVGLGSGLDGDHIKTSGVDPVWSLIVSMGILCMRWCVCVYVCICVVMAMIVLCMRLCECFMCVYVCMFRCNRHMCVRVGVWVRVCVWCVCVCECTRCV